QTSQAVSFTEAHPNALPRLRWVGGEHSVLRSAPQPAPSIRTKGKAQPGSAVATDCEPADMGSTSFESTSFAIEAVGRSSRADPSGPRVITYPYVAARKS